MRPTQVGLADGSVDEHLVAGDLHAGSVVKRVAQHTAGVRVASLTWS